MIRSPKEGLWIGFAAPASHGSLPTPLTEPHPFARVLRYIALSQLRGTPTQRLGASVSLKNNCKLLRDAIMPTLRIHYIECIRPSVSTFWDENDKEFAKTLDEILTKQNELLGKAGALTGFMPFSELKDLVNMAGDAWKIVTDLIDIIPFDNPDQVYVSLSDQERQQMIWPIQKPYVKFTGSPGTNLDLSIPYDKSITIYLWDRDTGSDDDILGSLSVISNEFAGKKGEVDTVTAILVGSKQENSLYYIVFSGGVALNRDGNPSPLGTSAAALSKIGSSSSALQVDPTDLLSVTAFSGVPGGSALFAIKGDRKVWSQYYDPRVENPAWSGWFELGGSVSPETTNVSAVSSLPGATSLFVVGLDGRIWSKFYDPRIADAKWSDWFPLGDNTFPPTSVVTSISGVPGGVTLFVIGHDRKVWSQYYDPRVENPAWSGWFELGGGVSTETTNVSAVSSLPGATSLFVVGLDGRIWSKFYDPRIADAKWSDWFPLGDNTFPPTSVVTAISGVPGGVALFVVGHDRKVWSQYYDPRVENPAWSGWFPL